MTIRSTADGGAITKFCTPGGELDMSREDGQIVLRKYSGGWRFVRVASPAEAATFERLLAKMWAGRTWPLPRNQKIEESVNGEHAI